jgi:hypothetical protein
MEFFTGITFSFQRDSFDYESTKSLIQRNGGTILYRSSMAGIRLLQPRGAVNIESGNYVDIGFVCDSDAAGQLMDIGSYIVNKANPVAVATMRRLGAYGDLTYDCVFRMIIEKFNFSDLQAHQYLWYINKRCFNDLVCSSFVQELMNHRNEDSSNEDTGMPPSLLSG